MILVTGGAGFIGSNFIHRWCAQFDEGVVNIDKLTYAGNVDNLAGIDSDKYKFIQGDICDAELVDKVLKEFKPKYIVHFAAESHVDRSIDGPSEFIKTNVLGTFNLLECSRLYYNSLPSSEKGQFRFHHISTDEVYGSLKSDEPGFSERHQYQPNSPYSASKASSDHLVRAYFHTYGLPTVTTNCSNNYGPRQNNEKLIPLMITNAVKGLDLPIYGNGLNVRDWLYVDDHCDAIIEVLLKGDLGEVYNIGGQCEKNNLEVVREICDILDKLRPLNGKSYKDQIRFVKDRAGHDWRYAIDISKISKHLSWQPKESFSSGLEKTINWYLYRR